MKVVWTAGMTKMLTELIECQNFSYEDISRLMTAEYGVRFTKNSCIGKAHRLGILKMTRISAPKKDKPLTLYQLRDGLCKWPLGKVTDRPPFLYCGKLTGDPNHPYCSTHSEQAYGKTTSDSASLYRFSK